MKEVSLHSIGLIQRIQEHDDFKPYMLNYINNSPIQPNDYGSQSQDYVSNTDWYDGLNHKDREYVNEFRIILEPYLRNIADRLYFKDMVMGNMWFQQYSHNSKHQWHNHEGCNWSAVYYVQMPDDKIKTLLWDYHQNKIVDDIDLQEGDLFVFPSNVLHCSPPNFTNKLKTIISFNMNGVEVTKIKSWRDEYSKKYWTPPN